MYGSTVLGGHEIHIFVSFRRIVSQPKPCYHIDMGKYVIFQGGTLVLRDVGTQERPPAPFKLIKERWRCEGYHYGSLQPYLQEQEGHDTVPRWQPLNLKMQETREPHDYQGAALSAWELAERSGRIGIQLGGCHTFCAI